MFGAAIRPKGTVQMTLGLRGDLEYRMITAGDQRAGDLDLKVTDSQGTVVAQDTRTDPAAQVRFRPAGDGDYTVTVKLFAGTDTSFCTLVILQEGGWNVPLEPAR